MDTVRTGVPLQDATWTIPDDVHHRHKDNVRWELNLNPGIAQKTAQVANEPVSRGDDTYKCIFTRFRTVPIVTENECLCTAIVKPHCIINHTWSGC